jgi:hypothetical protein
MKLEEMQRLSGVPIVRFASELPLVDLQSASTQKALRQIFARNLVSIWSDSDPRLHFELSDSPVFNRSNPWQIL